jgi:hypothetical protein
MNKSKKKKQQMNKENHNPYYLLKNRKIRYKNQYLHVQKVLYSVVQKEVALSVCNHQYLHVQKVQY